MSDMQPIPPFKAHVHQTADVETEGQPDSASCELTVEGGSLQSWGLPTATVRALTPGLEYMVTFSPVAEAAPAAPETPAGNDGK